MSDTLTVVYPGLDEKVRKSQLSIVESISDLDKKFYPREPKREFFYYNKTKDLDAEKVRKARRRKDYRAFRMKEVLESLEDIDAVLEVCGLVFPKDEPVEVNVEALIPKEREKLHVYLKRGQLLHLDDWKKANAPKEEPKEEKQEAPKPEMKRGGPPSKKA